MTPLFLIGCADNGNALCRFWIRRAGGEFQSCQQCFCIKGIFSSTEKLLWPQWNSQCHCSRCGWMHLLYFFSIKQPMSWPPTPTPANCNRSESHSLLLFCVAACLFVCARLRLKSLFVFLFFILLRRFLMPPLVYCRVRRRVTWRDVDAWALFMREATLAARG